MTHNAENDAWVYGFLANRCPKCHQPIGKPCRSLTSGRSTDTHAARRAAWFEPRVIPSDVTEDGA